mmetsp:Transcript_22067/g.58783  ORF Transcript_22067/g.58783 Transcript_22067/m.58783 type:complete len:315 (+) Transcript_22067:1233-2177(+)
MLFLFLDLLLFFRLQALGFLLLCLDSFLCPQDVRAELFQTLLFLFDDLQLLFVFPAALLPQLLVPHERLLFLALELGDFFGVAIHPRRLGFAAASSATETLGGPFRCSLARFLERFLARFNGCAADGAFAWSQNARLGGIKGRRRGFPRVVHGRRSPFAALLLGSAVRWARARGARLGDTKALRVAVAWLVEKPHEISTQEKEDDENQNLHPSLARAGGEEAEELAAGRSAFGAARRGRGGARGVVVSGVFVEAFVNGGLGGAAGGGEGEEREDGGRRGGGLAGFGVVLGRVFLGGDREHCGARPEMGSRDFAT